jgi:NAD(P)-dependent dehydrogenase (short-subunit alcohol dehydrogenase family)
VTILVTGATGLVGRLLIDELAGRGAEVRAVTRRPGAVTFPAGVTVAEGFAGVDAVFLHPRAVADPAGFLARARAGGVPQGGGTVRDERGRSARRAAVANRGRPQQGGRGRRRRERDELDQPASQRVREQHGPLVRTGDPGRRHRPARTYTEWVTENASAFR